MRGQIGLESRRGMRKKRTVNLGLLSESKDLSHSGIDTPR
jgi:hypothetical protein